MSRDVHLELVPAPKEPAADPRAANLRRCFMSRDERSNGASVIALQIIDRWPLKAPGIEIMVVAACVEVDGRRYSRIALVLVGPRFARAIRIRRHVVHGVADSLLRALAIAEELRGA